MTQDLQAIQKILHTRQQIVITMHQNPDADALGSSLALAALLKKYNHKVRVISPTKYPDFLAWLPGTPDVLVFKKGAQKELKAHILAADTIFCMDFSHLTRLDTMADAVKQAPGTKIIIDHHPHPEDFAQLYIWDDQAPATALLLYNMIIAMGAERLIDIAMATCLYTGISTDTGLFQNPNTNSEAHLAAASLLKKGVKPAQINQCMYGNESLDKLRFLAHTITHRMVVMPKCHAAYFAIPSADFKKFNLKKGDTEGLVHYALRLKGVVCAVLIREEKSDIRLSFRSIGDVAVNTLAKNHFSGGGHKNAAGGIAYTSLSDTVAKVEQILWDHFKTQ